MSEQEKKAIAVEDLDVTELEDEDLDSVTGGVGDLNPGCTVNPSCTVNPGCHSPSS
jgi:hypothetical protein